MVVYVNEKNEIKDVNTTTDATLTPIEIPEGTFNGWPVAKIYCHKVSLEDGQYTGYTPCVDTKIIEHIERLGAENEKNASDNEMLASCILEMSEVLYA